MVVPFEETRDKDGTIKTPEAYGYMFFIKIVEGKTEYTQWTMRADEILGNETFQIEAKGPKDVDMACKARNLNGPNMSSWNGSVKVCRQRQDTETVKILGTVKELRQQAALVKLAAKSVSDEFQNFETSREGLQKLAATIAKALQTIDKEAESSSTENKESKDGSSEDKD